MNIIKIQLQEPYKKGNIKHFNKFFLNLISDINKL